MTRLVLLCFTVMATWSLPASVSAQKIRLIIAADTKDATVGDASERDAKKIRDLFSDNIGRRNSTEAVTLPPEKMTSREILAAVRNIPADPDDTLVFYFSGHGGFTNDDQHLLALENGRDLLRRDDLLRTMKSRRVRLSVLITESCFNFVELPPKQPENRERTVNLPVTNPLFTRLFLQVRGTVDLNGCRKGQKSLTYPDARMGSLFTSAFENICRANVDKTNLGWEDILTLVDDQTTREFKKIYRTGVTTDLGNGRKVRQRSQNPAFVTPLAVTKIGQPDNQDSVSTIATEVEIDAKTGEVFELEIRRRFYPDDNSTVERILNRLKIGKATLVYAVDGTAMWSYGMLVLADRPAIAPRVKLGIRAVNVPNGSGTRITKVTPNSPATMCQLANSNQRTLSLQVGDVITHVNGSQVFDEQSLVSLMKFAPDRHTIQFRRPGNTQLMKLVVNLRPGFDPQSDPKADRLGLEVKDPPMV